MPARRRSAGVDGASPDLFSVDPSGNVAHQLDGFGWPDEGRFPLNRASSRVRTVVWADLIAASDPVIVAGYSSIAQLIDFVAEWSERRRSGVVRVLLGAEPYPTLRRDFSSATAGFTEEVRRYWLEERGVSLRLSALIVQTIIAIDSGRLKARFVHGSSPLHAKIYLGHQAATLGSSNFTGAGLSSQIEVNARFTAADDPDRCAEVVTIAENLWAAGTDWTDELRGLLDALLQVVGWREALARACAELLEGDWATRYLDDAAAAGGTLWPSQRAGIAQALWVTKDVGSVLIADATGSGKTRMGAHLVRAVRDRLWATGRVRRDLAVLVSPPAVEETWQREAVACGLPLNTASHGLLSRPGADRPRVQEEAVARAQILAVDEAHNFLNRDANRTRQLRASRADHVLLFTATPINRGAGDLLSLVSLLGADNFDDATLAVLNRLERRRGGDNQVLTPTELDGLRAEIGRFTVRRTKVVLNHLVDRDPAAYAHPDTGRVCRYPVHQSRTYRTGETDADAKIAAGIRDITKTLTGVAQLERVIAVPAPLRNEYSDQRWLQFRLISTRGLAAHHVLGALRSSRAAVIEHLSGTTAAVKQFGLDAGFKATDTGNVIGKLDDLAKAGPPTVDLDCDLPDWLLDDDTWAESCRREADLYRGTLASAQALSSAREVTKAKLIATVAAQHDRVLAFDHHLITLAALAGHLQAHDIAAVVATGGDPTSRRNVERLFARTATGQAVALCSDALNEALNLQGASALVHLDLPTTLRVAEQRVGRVDRMDSPHDEIEVWWPRDGEAFATRANELLANRSEESARLLGSNLHVPQLTAGATDDTLVAVEDRIAEAEQPGAEAWDGIKDALDSVRQLVTGPAALILPDLYDQLRHTRHRVIARIATLASDQPWVFLAIAGSTDGAPRWHYLDGSDLRPTADLDSICSKLRTRLADDPPSRDLDTDGLDLLDRALTTAARSEFDLLPRRMQRALQQMNSVLGAWITHQRQAGNERDAQVLHDLAQLARPQGADTPVDPYLIAERWLTLIAPTLDEHRRRNRQRAYTLITDVTRRLNANPLATTAVTEAFEDLPPLTPLAERVNACILGVPTAPNITNSRSSTWHSSQ